MFQKLATKKYEKPPPLTYLRESRLVLYAQFRIACKPEDAVDVKLGKNTGQPFLLYLESYLNHITE